jgi:mannose-6-phosphate isomerase
MGPINLPPNQPPDRFYRGGSRISRFRGAPSSGPRTPEDWVASTTSLFGRPDIGTTHLPDGRLLVDHLAEDPVGWLGPDHVRAWGADPSLLVKLLDAGERLPVHAHPDRTFSSARLGLRHGKTEAWIALAPAMAYLGFRRQLDLRELYRWVLDQQVDRLLSALNAVPLTTGDAILVPAGLPHAIAAGAFLVEVQEPTDLSILLEWRDFAIDGRSAGHLGIGFHAALQAIDRTAWSIERLGELVGGRSAEDGSLFPSAADPFFRAERHAVIDDRVLDAGYSVLVVTAGEGTMENTAGVPIPIKSGETILVPFSAGECTIHGHLELIRCRPPLPAERAGVGARRPA